MNNDELIKKAERGEWDLECDRRVLDQMQNVAQKLESRSANTKTSIDSMVLGVDELKVKLNNLNKINSIRNTHYCENVLREDETSRDESSVSSQKPEPPSPQQVAIDNGLKLMSKCFDKNVVRHDASSDATTTTYRPIDKYANVLPHLIGSDEWNRKWHAGILDKDPGIQRRRQTSSTSHDEPTLAEPSTSNLVNRRESLESVAAKSSVSSDQMCINSLQPSGVTYSDTEEPELDSSRGPIVPSSSMFQQPPDQRRIVNLFNDEPPSLESSPSAVKRPVVNLFDDYGSVDSFPASDTSTDDQATKSQPAQPPVDLFNDNEFESFIGKLEQQQQQEPPKSVKNSPLPADKNPIVGDMKKIADEIKKVQLRKVGADGDGGGAKSAMDEKKSTSSSSSSNTTTTAARSSLDFKQMLSKTLEKKPAVDAKPKPKMDEVKKSTPPPPQVEQKVKKTAANLFDDDESDSEVAAVVAAAAQAKEAPAKFSEKPKEAQKKAKLTNLFDDDDEDDDFLASIVKKREAAMPSKPITVSKKLFDDVDEQDGKSISTSSKTKSLFDDEHEPKVKPSPVAATQTREAIKTLSEPEQRTSEGEKHIEKLPDPMIDAVERSSTIETTAAAQVEGKVTNTPSPTARKEKEPKLSEKVVEAEKSSPRKDENQSTQFNVPSFPSDEPPDDDTWPTDEPTATTFDEHDNRVRDFGTPKTSISFPTVPIFDELPPEDDFEAGKQPPIPEPSFYLEDEEPPLPLPLKVETPKKVQDKPKSPADSPVSTGIRGKLDDLFKKQQEKEAAAASVREEKKEQPKKLAGKLSDMKINVGALMPGMRPPPPVTRKSVEEKEIQSPKAEEKKKDEGSEKRQQPEKVAKSTARATDASNNEEEERLNLLNNDISKSRAKIQVKRRPSTRQARQASYQKTMSAVYDEVSEEITTKSTRPLSAVFGEETTTIRKSVEFIEKKSAVSSKQQILSSSIFGDEASDSEDILVSKRETTMTAETSSSSKSSTTVVTNKIPVFYDDEADTKKMLDAQREEKRKDDNSSSVKKAASIFDDESDDDDLFGKKSKKSTTTSASSKSSTTKKSQSLFEDEDDGESLFKAKSTKVAATSSKKLFESDEDVPAVTNKPSAASSSKTKTEKAVSKSLFGDDDDEDDDLFSSKPKLSTKSPAAKPSTTTVVKKPPSKVVDDPLKDLWND